MEDEGSVLLSFHMTGNGFYANNMHENSRENGEKPSQMARSLHGQISFLSSFIISNVKYHCFASSLT